MTLTTLPSITFLILFSLGVCDYQRPIKTGFEGHLLPSFNILLQDSTTYVNTTTISSGRPVAIVYFSPYCPYCRAQIREMVDEIDRLKNIQLYLVTPFKLPALKKFYKEFQLDKYPNITIGVDTGNVIAKYFGITSIPYTAIYGKTKRLNNSFMGRVYVDQIESVAKK